jgi:DNA-directed RNA polymerase sigma subunit (sigma70/sigma32)
MSDFIDPKESERMIFALAHRVKRRLQSLPQSIMSYEDIEQELWIAWCKARDAFEPSRGIPWAAYLQRGMRQHINRVVEKNIERFEGQTFALSLDESFGEDGDTTLGEIIPAADPLPCNVVEGKSNYEKAMSVMSGRAKVFVLLLNEQPKVILDEVLMAQDKAEHAVKLGAPFNAPRRITAMMVFDLMGASRPERARITREVEKIGMRLSK